MKSEKKSNELNCVPNGIVKEEPCKDTCKMIEKGGGGNNGEVPDGDVKPCTREPNAATTNPEDTTIKSNKTCTNNQQASNPIKLENNSFVNDCGGPAISKSDTNPVGKCGRNGPSGGESQFMQQQSQIFVFSTMLANKGAEAVLRGQFPSMVAFHCAQPDTRQFLQKHPNKGNKGGQSPAEWLNNFNPNGQKNQQTSANNFTRQTPELPVLDPDPPPFWNEQSNPRNGSGEKSVGNAESSVDDTINKVVNSQPSPHSLGDTNCSSPGSLQPSLQGVKVPDENLTPQQRQHREESLATIRKMQILLFSDRKESPEGSLPTTQGNQTQTFKPEGVNSPAISPLDNFSSGVDWDKLENQLIDTKNKANTDNYAPVASSAGNVPPVSRSQGPPPPYHQSTRPASVPAALQSSNPSSPNNPTSTLSLPSPRASSALNSPADYGRQFHHGGQRPGYLPATGSPMTQDSLSSGIARISDGIENHLNHSNPGTPGSHQHLIPFSPAGPTAQKDSIDFASSQSPSVDDIFCQTMQSANQEQRETTATTVGAKEANLMPVPSPQQIQYLNTFEGQELTIQKQPNTSLKDGNSPSNNSAIRMLSETPTSLLTEDTVDRGFSGPLHSPRTPRTPSNNTPFDSSSMTTGAKIKSDQTSPASYGQNLTDSIGRGRAPPESPKPKDVPVPANKKQHQINPGHSNDSKISLQTNSQDFSCVRSQMNVRGQPENVPLNPNNINSCMGIQGTVNSNHFDPITSLAQMSQQFPNITPSNSLGDGPIMHSGNPPGIQQNMHSMQEMNAAGGDYDVGGFSAGLSGYNPTPRMGNLGIPNRPLIGYGPMHQAAYHGEPHGPQRPMDSHNSMRPNVQVKPGAPNTIQYLPAAKPNPCQGGPRGPPSLDFLQNFTNPSSQRCFPNNMGPHPNSMHNMQQNVVFNGINRAQRPNGFQAGQTYPHNQMRPQIMSNMHQGPSPIRMQHMVGGGVFPGSRMNFDNKQFGGEMMPQMSNQPNLPRMYIPGNQVNNVGMRSRASVQPGIHPNVDGTGNSFKNGPFIAGPGNPTSDPNYAQQYHNFQQQLYATGTRASVPQHQNHHMGTNSPSFLPER